MVIGMKLCQRKNIPPTLVPKVMGTQIYYQAGVADEAVWKPTENWNFSCSSAKKDYSLQSIISHMEALRAKLPTNEKIRNFGVEPINCSYCSRPGMDEIDHVFVSGHFANHI
ncbi:hypothetical protein H5410_030540 [Solanum commersonii]|uniref:Reverse transcriptase zinc-binding domain-containing protein n=1 Tax=Solanum commersonii TaxID=4109 RepID=A0A9J5YFY0_SOLCO|nr:hypothetical protein H5410_030540 [Solanum commersonii]